MKNSKTTRIERDKKIVNNLINSNAYTKETVFNDLFNKYKTAVRNKIVTSTKVNNDIAEDLLMEIFMKIYSNINKFDPNKGALSTWVFRIAINHIIDFNKKVKGNIISLSELYSNISDDESDETEYSFQIEDIGHKNGADEIILSERLEIINKAISSIKNKTIKEIITLRAIDELSYEEITDRLNLPIGTVKAYVSRAKDEIKSYLRKKKFEFSL